MRTLGLLLSAVLALSLGACIGDPGAYGGDDTGDDDAPPPPPPPGSNQVSGDLTADATWSGDVEVTGDTVIKPGVTISVDPGAKIYLKDAYLITVEGSFTVAGTAAAGVEFIPSAGDWSGLKVASGGSLTLRFASISKAAKAVECAAGALACTIEDSQIIDNQMSMQIASPAQISRSTLAKTGGAGLYVLAGADVDVVDSRLTTAGGDIVVQSGGKLRIDYSEIGEVVDSYEHCGIHINGAEQLVIDHSVIHSNVYGAMIGGTTNARINNSNWQVNDIQASEVGVNTGLDLKNNYWDSAPPAFGDTSGAAMAPLPAGPR